MQGVVINPSEKTTKLSNIFSRFSKYEFVALTNFIAEVLEERIRA
jgi:hypothetical protein